MLGHKKISLVLVLLGLLAKNVQATIYNVIAEPHSNLEVAVVVDETIYPLEASFGILYRGDAPQATTGYYYAFVENESIKIPESFIRPPLENGLSTTINEFFNRSISNYEIETLPQVLTPISSIHRIKSDLHIPNQIPTIHIYGNASATKFLQDNQLDDNKVKLNVAYIGLNKVQMFENVKVSLSGRSSRWVSKLSYGLKFDKKNDTTLFGFKNFKLRSLDHDPSYLREMLCHNVLKSSGIPASEFSYVRLFIDEKAVGLYGIIETFQDPWTAAEFADGKKGYKSGYLYQGTGFSYPFAEEVKISDLRYEGTNTTNYSFGQYKIKAGKHKKRIDSYQDLQDFTQFINESSVEKTPESEWEKRLDVDGFLRCMAIEDLLGLGDGYMTLANNFYLYRDPDQNNRLTYFPADMDTTIGISLSSKFNLMMSGNYSEHPGIFLRPLTSKIFSYPSYLSKYQEYLLKLTQTLINPSVLFPYIDSVVNMIRPDVEWDKSLSRAGEIMLPFGIDNITILMELSRKFIGSDFEIPPDESIVTFDVAINGPYRTNVSTYLKGFIKEKSENVLAYYNQSNNQN